MKTQVFSEVRQLCLAGYTEIELTKLVHVGIAASSACMMLLHLT